MHAFWLSLAVIFVAELGDKSQLMALAFATRYRTLPVLIGITTATALVHLFSVVIGDVLGSAIPEKPIAIVAAISFLFFGLWTLRGDELSAGDKERAAIPAKHVIIAVGTVFSYQSLAIKQCWRQSHWQLVMASGGPGLAQLSEWLLPMHLQSLLVVLSAHGCQKRLFVLAQPFCFLFLVHSC